MVQYRTEQERIDAMTVQISNPNIVGSGFIQHPPQRPFEKTLEMQPPTVAHFDFPTEYSCYNGGGSNTPHKSQPRRAEAAHPHQRAPGYQQANGRAPHVQANGRTAQPHYSSQRSNGGGAASPRTAPSNSKARAPAAPRAAPQPRQALPQKAPQGVAGGAHASAHQLPAADALPPAPRQEAGVPNLAHLSLADSAEPDAGKAEKEQQCAKLSKSQQMRLRKKKREGKI